MKHVSLRDHRTINRGLTAIEEEATYFFWEKKIFKTPWINFIHLKYSLIVMLVPSSCPTLCDPMDCSPPGSSVHGDSPGKNTGVACYTLLQGIFPPQGLNLGLLHCRWILYLSEPLTAFLKVSLWNYVTTWSVRPVCGSVQKQIHSLLFQIINSESPQNLKIHTKYVTIPYLHFMD